MGWHHKNLIILPLHGFGHILEWIQNPGIGKDSSISHKTPLNSVCHGHLFPTWLLLEIGNSSHLHHHYDDLNIICWELTVGWVLSTYDIFNPFNNFVGYYHSEFIEETMKAQKKLAHSFTIVEIKLNPILYCFWAKTLIASLCPLVEKPHLPGCIIAT